MRSNHEEYIIHITLENLKCSVCTNLQRFTYVCGKSKEGTCRN